ncbi:hypothetical protein GCM10009828_004300 [Actinoplanes couchii]|uniref:Uncharacterized protein n=1 Tax=Actinoplanes couchii TaxID=403638 RepID=A0ABQ3XI47_9ACTN|nr:hypothetical protein Aco03nite_065680 [Actinoplanes couchii]
MSDRRANAPISAITLVAGSPNGIRQADRSSRMNSRCGNGSGAARFTAPVISSCSIRKRTARTKSCSWIHETYCRPPATGPPSPHRTRPLSTSKMPPRSGLITIAARSATLRVCGVAAFSCSASQFRAIRMLYSQ